MAALGIIKDLAPAWLALQQTHAHDRMNELAKFISSAAGEGVQPIEKSFAAMHENLMQGVPLHTGVKYGKTTRVLLEGEAGFNKAPDAVDAVGQPPVSLVKNAELAETLAKNRGIIGFRGVLEVVNFANAYGEWKAANDQALNRKAIVCASRSRGAHTQTQLAFLLATAAEKLAQPGTAARETTRAANVASRPSGTGRRWISMGL